MPPMIVCPNCGKSKPLTSKTSGKKVTCHKCGTEFVAPSASATVLRGVDDECNKIMKRGDYHSEEADSEPSEKEPPIIVCPKCRRERIGDGEKCPRCNRRYVIDHDPDLKTVKRNRMPFKIMSKRRMAASIAGIIAFLILLNHLSQRHEYVTHQIASTLNSVFYLMVTFTIAFSYFFDDEQK